MQPLSPVNSINLPNADHWSNQKDVDAPFWMSSLISCEARGRSFRSFFYIQEPKELESLTLQKEPFLMRYLWIHWTHKADRDERMRHINFRQETLLASARDLKPKPPSSFGEQASNQVIFAFWVDITGPGQMKAEHILLMSWIHWFGSRKADIQRKRYYTGLIVFFVCYYYPYFL